MFKDDISNFRHLGIPATVLFNQPSIWFTIPMPFANRVPGMDKWLYPNCIVGCTLQWRHNGHDCVSNHQPHDCLLSRLFRRRSKKTSKLRVTGLCVENSPGTGEFSSQMTSNAENVSICWRHHELFRHAPISRETVTYLKYRHGCMSSSWEWIATGSKLPDQSGQK